MEGLIAQFVRLADRHRRHVTEGQGMVEYGLIVALIAVASIVILGLLGTSIGDAFEIAINTLTGGTVE